MEKVNLSTETKNNIGNIYYQVYRKENGLSEAVITDGHTTFTRKWRDMDYKDISKLEDDISYYINECIKRLS